LTKYTLKQLQIVLIFSYIGMTQELKATVSPMSVKLEGSETNLEEVIITAQGIKGKTSSWICC
jgi:hypothetical protein